MRLHEQSNYRPAALGRELPAVGCSEVIPEHRALSKDRLSLLLWNYTDPGRVKNSG